MVLHIKSFSRDVAVIGPETLQQEEQGPAGGAPGYNLRFVKA